MAARIVELEEEAAAPTPSGPQSRIFIATPAYGCKLTVQYFQCLLQTQLALTAAGYGVTIDMLGNESLITRARNILVKRFLQSNSTHLLFIDADISWHPDAIFRLLKKNEGVVSTSYPKKYIDWTKVQSRVDNDGQQQNEPMSQVGLDFNVNVTQSQVQVVEGFAEVLDAATGFMLVRRSAIEKMYRNYEKELLVQNDLLGAQKAIPDYVAIFDCMIDPTTRRPLSEDFAFSRRWQQLGGKVYMDLMMPLGHTGGFHYEGQSDVLSSGKLCGRDSKPIAKDEVKATPGKKTVLLAVISDSDNVALGFCMSMTRILAGLQRDNSFIVQVNVFSDKNEACDHMAQYDKYDILLMLDGMLSVEESTALSMLHSPAPFEVALYPTENGLDWTGLQTGQSAKAQVMQYRVLLRDDKSVEAAPLGVAKMTRQVIDVIKSRLDPRATYCNAQRRLWFHDGVLDDRRILGDEMFCRMWGGDIAVNKSDGIARLGNMTFQGVLLARQQIR